MKKTNTIYLSVVCAFLLALTACAEFGSYFDKEVEIDSSAPAAIKPVSFSALPGWSTDNHARAVSAFAKSCKRILSRPADLQFGPEPFAMTYGQWQPACHRLAAMKDIDKDNEKARHFFEEYFQPYQVSAGGQHEEGLFTGYYEASLKGSRVRDAAYQYPLYAKPSDLVMVDLGEFRDDLKGRRIAGRVINGRLHEYESREEIDAGMLPQSQQNVIAWVDNPVDAFFLHIQGSGVVELPNDEILRVGYAGQNGHPYYAIGRELINRGALKKEEVSLQSIRQWMDHNPGEAAKLMHTNPSYVFFRQLSEGGPIGGEGLVLTAGRSLAVDRSKLPYGIPVWVDIEPPIDGEPDLRRLMVAQDTGGAIRGAVRGDVFWGYGLRAEYVAGKMKSKGRYWALLPR